MEDIIKKGLQEVLEEVCDKKVTELKEEQNFLKDFDLDSVDIVKFQLLAFQKFEIELSSVEPEEWESLFSVQGAVNFVKSKLGL